MRNIVSLLSAAVLLGGCGTSNVARNEIMKQYKQENERYSAMMKSEKMVCQKDGESAVVLNATYLPASKPHSGSERFIVGVYLSEDEDSARFLEKLRLEGKAPRHIVPVSENSLKEKEMVFVVPWRDYFKVEFPPVKEERFDITLEDPLCEGEKMHFAKRPKYIFSKKAY